MPDDTTPPAPPAPPASNPPVPPSEPTAPPAPSAGNPPAPPAPPAEPPKAPTVPETYTLALPKDSTLDASVLERTAAVARELGLSNAAAQQLVETTHAEVSQYLTAEHAAFEAKAAEWSAQALADPTYGKTPDERRAAIDKGRQVIDVHFAKVDPDGAKALKGFLDDTKYGNHPAVVSLMHWLGQQGAEGPLVLPNATSTTGARTKEQAYREMFPNSYDAMVGATK